MAKYLALLTAALTCVSSVHAGDWAQWRGPLFNGSTDERDLPSQWSKTENIAWSADLPGVAAATPIVCQQRVLLSGVDAANNMLQASCFDRASGKLLWKQDVAQGIRKDNRSNFASASPVTDGKIYLINFAGEVAVVNAANGEVLHVIPMDQPAAGEVVRASISAADGQLFIRTTRKLYCVGKGS